MRPQGKQSLTATAGLVTIAWPYLDTQAVWPRCPGGGWPLAKARLADGRLNYMLLRTLAQGSPSAFTTRRGSKKQIGMVIDAAEPGEPTECGANQV